MTDQTDEPRSSQAPAEQPSKPNNSEQAAPIRDVDAYTRSQAEKDARLASKALKEVDGLRTQVNDLTSNVNDLLKELKAEKEARITAEKTAKRGQMISAVVSKFNLPAELAKRLHGETAEELEADAAELAKLVAPQTPPAQTRLRPVVTGNVGIQPTTDSDIGRQLATRSLDGNAGRVKLTQPYDPDDN